MKFYRRIAPVSAISFDLDDTLYENHPVMVSVEDKMIAYFERQFSTGKTPEKPLNQLDYHYWYKYRQQVLKANAQLIHDVTALRLESYFLGIKALGVASNVAREEAQKALAYFIEHRSHFSVPQNIHQLLAKLSAKCPLLAITNGNVDTQKIGIDSYFTHIFHAGNGFKKKPADDMFSAACEQLNIQPKQLLHIGDCGHADILGALQAGCQTAWFPQYKIGKPLSVLPHIELLDLAELESLL